MAEDSSENLWFGTNGVGVSRYNGSTWQTFKTADGLASDFVQEILVDRSGSVWFGTDGGVSRYDGVSWRTFTTADGLAGNIVNSLLQDPAGNIWAGGNGVVSRYDGTSWTTLTVPGPVPNLVFSMLVDRVGRIWLGTFEGVFRYDGATWTSFTTADGLPGNRVLSIQADPSGNILAGTNGGVSRYDGSTWSNVLPYNVSSMLVDRSGNLWFGMFPDGGANRYNGSTLRTFMESDGLAGNEVHSILEDRSGNLWFGTNVGLSRFDQSTFETFTTADGLADNHVTSMLVDRSANLWFGTFGGVSRYTGDSWQTFTTNEGLASNIVNSMMQDRSGNIWFGTYNGLSRFDGNTWQTFTTNEGLASNTVNSMLEDRAGNLWFGCWAGGIGGLSRYHNGVWTTFTAANGLASDIVNCILEDRAGNLWFGTNAGASRYDGQNFQTFATDSGLADNNVHSMLEDRSGNLWFAYGLPVLEGPGVTRYNGSSWRTFTTADGLAGNAVYSMIEDRAGHLWFATGGGASRFDGVLWRNFTSPGVLRFARSVLEDSLGNIWFGGLGATRYEPDRVGPQTLFLGSPPPLSASRFQSAVFTSAFGELGTEFSYQMDADPWSDWSQIGNWFQQDVTDGVHVLNVRSRDFVGNIDPTNAKAVFEVDATPAVPVITSLSYGAVVRGSAEVHGTATDPRFLEYRVDVRPAGAATWNPPVAIEIARSGAPVSSGLLATWNTSTIPDGVYELRLSVSDSLGLTGLTQVTVNVDNQFPFADVTAPARIVATSGGDIYTTNAEAHFYFPPRAFGEDALVTVTPLPTDSVPVSVPPQAARVLPGYEIGWTGSVLSKPARFTLSYAGASLPSGVPAIYHSVNGTSWARLGGTVEEQSHRISLAVAQPGRYALFVDQGAPGGPEALTAVSFTPRVFSPSGTFADRDVGISFTLGRPGPVTIRVYNRAGRIVREVLSGQPLGAGSNLIPWDGRDRDGHTVTDGLYVVTVEALGQTERKTLAVVK